MITATRLETNLDHWMPIARHYDVQGGFLVVVVANFLSAEGTDVFLTDERGCALSMEAIKRFPHGTTHDEALIDLGYTIVVDEVIEPIPVVVEPEPVVEPVIESVISLLPPEILEVIAPNIVMEEL